MDSSMKLAFLSLPLSGHLNPMVAIGAGLAVRKHQVTFFGVLDTAERILSANLDFVPFGQIGYPLGTIPRAANAMGQLTADDFHLLIQGTINLANTVFSELPPLLQAYNPDVLVIDSLFPAGATIANHLRIPFATFHSVARFSHADHLQPLLDCENEKRKQLGLPLYADVLQDRVSPIASFSQMPKSFDLSNTSLPAHCDYVGPLIPPSKKVDFPWDKLTGKPLIYCCLGTLCRLDSIYQLVIDACLGLPVQLVVSTGGGELSLSAAPNCIVVPWSPQRELMAKAILCINACNHNTTLESLSCGVPLVGIDTALNDSTSMAERIRGRRVGRTVELKDLTVPVMRSLILDVLGNSTYFANARAIQREIKQLGDPVKRVCDIVEQRFDMSAFNGDEFVGNEVRKLVSKWGVKVIVETGSYLGNSTRAFASMVETVITIEICPAFWELGQHLDSLKNVRRILGDSPQVLAKILPDLQGTVLFYLDAHWLPHSPLLDELDAIALSGVKGPILAIHDFENPQRPEYQWDDYENVGPYSTKTIRPKLVQIYGENGWTHRHNSEASGQQIGIVYIEPVPESLRTIKK
jgi:zeaxanthin glucosyltransferase